MLSKVILPLIALAASCAVSVNAKIEYKTAETDMLYKRADDDSKYNPTSYLFFDREDDIIAPKANCTAETVNTRKSLCVPSVAPAYFNKSDQQPY